MTTGEAITIDQLLNVCQRLQEQGSKLSNRGVPWVWWEKPPPIPRLWAAFKSIWSRARSVGLPLQRQQRLGMELQNREV